jgi:hypothetical protein
MVTDSLKDPLFKDRFTRLQNLVEKNFAPLNPAEAGLFKLPLRIVPQVPAALRDHRGERTSERTNITQPAPSVIGKSVPNSSNSSVPIMLFESIAIFRSKRPMLVSTAAWIFHTSIFVSR